MKHKHCDVIKAWADGAEVQVKIDGEWCDLFSSPHVVFFNDCEYRVKPKPQVKVKLYAGNVCIFDEMVDDDCIIAEIKRGSSHMLYNLGKL